MIIIVSLIHTDCTFVIMNHLEDSHRLGRYKYHKTDGSVIQTFDAGECDIDTV